jgi:hypothetical protein
MLDKNTLLKITINGSVVLFFVFIILAIVSYFKVSDAKKTGKEISKSWIQFNTASYIILAIITFLVIAVSCGSSFQCFTLFFIFGEMFR